MEELLKERYASTRVSDLIVEPADPPTTSQTTELITKSLAFVKLYRLPRPIIKSDEWEKGWNDSALDAESKLESMRRDHGAESRGMLIARREGLLRHVLGADDRRRPITMLLRNQSEGALNDSGAYVYSMVSFVNRKMIHAIGSVDQASALVYTGNRDWESLDRWEKINVALAAKENFQGKQAAAHTLRATRSHTKASGSESHLQSLGHHVPSLTARQHRRSGISEMELRARWGAGGVVQRP